MPVGRQSDEEVDQCGCNARGETDQEVEQCGQQKADFLSRSVL